MSNDDVDDDRSVILDGLMLSNEITFSIIERTTTTLTTVEHNDITLGSFEHVIGFDTGVDSGGGVCDVVGLLTDTI